MYPFTCSILVLCLACAVFGHGDKWGGKQKSGFGGGKMPQKKVIVKKVPVKHIVKVPVYKEVQVPVVIERPYPVYVGGGRGGDAGFGGGNVNSIGLSLSNNVRDADSVSINVNSDLGFGGVNDFNNNLNDFNNNNNNNFNDFNNNNFNDFNNFDFNNFDSGRIGGSGSVGQIGQQRPAHQPEVLVPPPPGKKF